MALMRNRHPLAKHWAIWQQITGQGPVDRGCVYVVDWAENLSIPDCRVEREDGLCREFIKRLHETNSPLTPNQDAVVVKYQGRQRLIHPSEFGIVCQEP